MLFPRSRCLLNLVNRYVLMLTPLVPQKRAHVNVFRLLFPRRSTFLNLSLFRWQLSHLTLIFLLLYFFSDRALFYLALALLSRTVFNFSSVCGREYISNLSGIGVNINERSIMNERKPRLDAVNQKRLSLGFAVSKSFKIASRDRNNRDTSVAARMLRRDQRVG